VRRRGSRKFGASSMNDNKKRGEKPEKEEGKINQNKRGRIWPMG